MDDSKRPKAPESYTLFDFILDHEKCKKHQEYEYYQDPDVDSKKYLVDIFLVCEDCQTSYLIDTYTFVAN